MALNRRLLLWLPVLGICATSPARADIPAEAQQAFDAGDYAAAARLARTRQDADGLAFAARAVLATGMLSGATRIDNLALQDGKRLAEQAVALAPRHVEARLQLSIALGMMARKRSPAIAYASRLPQRARALINAVVSDAPREPWGHVIAGVWHSEGLRIGGEAARRTLGASLPAAEAAFARATSLSTSPTFPAMHAISLLALDLPGQRAAVAPALALATSRLPASAFEREMRRRAGDLQGLLARNDLDGVRSRLSQWL